MLKRVLIIKTSSLGDVIHTLPAITEAKNHHPDLIFDWVVEEAFSDIPRLHPAVDRIIPISLRRWRKNWSLSFKNREIQSFLNQLREKKYDLIIDAQGLFKSAILTKFAKGKVAGFDRKSAREGWVSSIFYNKFYFVEKNLHAILRLKLLFGQSLGYQANDVIDYGLSYHWDGKKAQKTICFLHATTWESKHWPQSYWQNLAEILGEKGFQIVLPWGNDAEKQKAIEIAADLPFVEVLPQMGLSELARYFSSLSAIVSVDTGLSHLAAAIGVPTISLYGATNPKLTSTKGNNQFHLSADYHCAPCLKRKCQYDSKDYNIYPPCYQSITPDRVSQLILMVIIFDN